MPRYEPCKQKNLLLCKGPGQFLASAIPRCPEPGPGSALHKPPLKNKTDPAFRGFCIKAGRMSILCSMKWLDGLSTPKTCRKVLVRATSSTRSSHVNCLAFLAGGLQPVSRLGPCYQGASSLWRPGVAFIAHSLLRLLSLWPSLL